MDSTVIATNKMDTEALKSLNEMFEFVLNIYEKKLRKKYNTRDVQ